MGTVIELGRYKSDKCVANIDDNNISVFNNSLYIFIGIPCSGKSTYAKILLSKKTGIVVISTDELRKELTGTYKFSQQSNNLVFTIAKERINSALSQGFDVVFDATNTNSKYRQDIIRIAKKNDSKAIAVIFKTPLNVCLERNRMRPFERNVPEEVIIAMSQYDCKVLKFEGFEEILEIN